MRSILGTFLILWLISVSMPTMAEISNPIQGRLANGLRYTLLPLHKEKGHIEIRMKVYAGAIDETDGQAGLAHMVEHLVFRATQAHPDGLMPYLHDNKWVRARNYNAVTTYDNTTYMLTPPSNSDLKQSLAVLAQMLFHAKLTPQDLDDERKIIMEEWRSGQGVANAMHRQRTDSVRSASRYTRHPVIGTPDSIQSMPAEQLQHFYHTWYAPNNMQLLIIGDIEPQSAVEFIRVFFSEAKARTLPERNYYEPELTDILRINKLQDPRSGVSQVAYIFRFDESRSRVQTEQGRYERLLDRIALSALTQRLRNQTEQLPQGVNSLVVRKSEIGKTTAALGLFAGVAETSHQLGLQQIFTEIERLKRFPLTEQELEKQKEPIREQLERAKQHKSDRDFQQWTQVMVDTVLSDKPYLSQPEIARLTEPLLAQITAEEVNGRVLQWLNAKDRIVQYQPPRATQIEPITESIIGQLQTRAQHSEIAPPQVEKVIVPMELSLLTGKSAVEKETVFNTQNVIHWQLPNGDKVVWLKLPLAEQRTYFQARSNAGFNAEGLQNWQSQIAAQLIGQNAPLDWEIEQLTRWKSLKKVNLSIKQTATQLIFEGSSDNHNIADLFRLYYAYQLETEVKEGLDETKESLARSIDLQNTEDNTRINLLSKLRFGIEDSGTLPNKTTLAELNEQILNAEWRKMTGAPTTFYIANNLSAQQMKDWVSTYLADIPRNTPLNSKNVLPLAGKGEARFAFNPEPKDDVRFWLFTPHQWQGKEAVAVSLLRHIVANKLKLALRDQQLSVYSLRFTSSLNPETQRIESELSFTANPAMTDKLVEQAKAVLKALPNQISQEEIQVAKAQFMKEESERLKSPNTWLNRLILSEEQFGEPRYLTDMQRLEEAISFEKMKEIAGKIYHADNQRLFVITPK